MILLQETLKPSHTSLRLRPWTLDHRRYGNLENGRELGTSIFICIYYSEEVICHKLAWTHPSSQAGPGRWAFV